MTAQCPVGAPAVAASAKTRHDVLTLRQWFNSMDAERAGHITKLQWTTFFRANPSFKSVFLDAGPHAAGVKAEAEEFRQLVRIRKEIDHGGGGTITFDKFVRYFRECGRVVEYETENAPTERIGAILGDLHGGPSAGPRNVMSDQQFEEFDNLTKHLDSRRRRSVHEEVRGQSKEPSGTSSNLFHTTPRLRGGRSATVGVGTMAPLLKGSNLSRLGSRLASKS